MALLRELRRRNVFKVGIAYVVVSWLILQVSDVILNNVEAPGWIFHVLLLFLAIGLPLILLFAWAFEITPDGIRREHEVVPEDSITTVTGQKLNRMIIAVLALALAYFAYDKFVVGPERPAAAAPVESAAVPTGVDAEVATESAGTAEKTIAVLPFVDMSENRDQEYLSDGISEELLNVLAKVPELRVTSRSSAFFYKGKEFKITDIGRELGVGHILEGSVRKSGNRVRITAQLIDVESDTHLWSESYDRNLDDIFLVQDEIAGEVVEQLKVELLDSEPAVAQADPKAYALYLRARQLGREHTPESLEMSNELLLQALEIDPNYAAARVALGSNRRRLSSLALQPGGGGLATIRPATLQAIPAVGGFMAARSAAPSNAVADDGLAATARELEHELLTDPGNLEAWLEAAALARDLGRPEEAVRLWSYVLESHPDNIDALSGLGDSHLHAGRLDAALKSYERAQALDPDRAGASYDVGIALLFKGEPEAAIAAFAQEGDKEYRMKGTAMALYTLGREDEYQKVMDDLLVRLGDSLPVDVAEVHAWASDTDQALDWLQKEVEAGGNLAGVSADPFFRPLHRDPRWARMLENVGAAPDQLAVIEFNPVIPE